MSRLEIPNIDHAPKTTGGHYTRAWLRLHCRKHGIPQNGKSTNAMYAALEAWDKSHPAEAVHKSIPVIWQELVSGSQTGIYPAYAYTGDVKMSKSTSLPEKKSSDDGYSGINEDENRPAKKSITKQEVPEIDSPRVATASSKERTTKPIERTRGTRKSPKIASVTKHKNPVFARDARAMRREVAKDSSRTSSGIEDDSRKRQMTTAPEHTFKRIRGNLKTWEHVSNLQATSGDSQFQFFGSKGATEPDGYDDECRSADISGEFEANDGLEYGDEFDDDFGVGAADGSIRDGQETTKTKKRVGDLYTANPLGCLPDLDKDERFHPLPTDCLEESVYTHPNCNVERENAACAQTGRQNDPQMDKSLGGWRLRIRNTRI